MDDDVYLEDVARVTQKKYSSIDIEDIRLLADTYHLVDLLMAIRWNDPTRASFDKLGDEEKGLVFLRNGLSELLLLDLMPEEAVHLKRLGRKGIVNGLARLEMAWGAIGEEKPDLEIVKTEK